MAESKKNKELKDYADEEFYAECERRFRVRENKGIECSDPECRFCVKGEKEKFCVVGGFSEHIRSEGIVPATGELAKDTEFTEIIYPYQGTDYLYLPRQREVIYSVCVDNWCLDRVAIYRKISYVFQCIEKNKNVENQCSDREIERKVVFYFFEMSRRKEGE
jgi:hypothetical protein